MRIDSVHWKVRSKSPIAQHKSDFNYKPDFS